MFYDKRTPNNKEEVMKRFTGIFLSILMILFLVASGNAEVKVGKAKKLTPELEKAISAQRAEMPSRTVEPIKSATAATKLTDTWYDYPSNSMIGRMLSLGNNGIHFTYMQLDNADATRIVTYDYYDLSLGSFYGPQGLSTGRTGWGNAATGPNGEALLVSHVPVLFYRDEGEGFYTLTSTDLSPLSVYPRLDASGNVLLIAAEDDQGAKKFQYWNDLNDLATFTTGDVPIPVANDTNFVLKSYEVYFSLNSQNPSQFGGILWFSDNDTNRLEGGIWAAMTSDAGETFSMIPVVFNKDYIMDETGVYNFTWPDWWIGQNTMDDNGVLHAVFTGIGVKVDTTAEPDTALHDVSVLYYWNSRDKQLVEFTDPMFKTKELIDSLEEKRFSGNAFGNCYPDVVTSHDGNIVVVMWSQPEIDQNGNVVTDSSGTYMVHDIYARVSVDGGKTFGDAFMLAGTPQVDDIAPNGAKFISSDNKLYYVWLQDNAAGSFVFGQNADGPASWYFDVYDLSGVVGIADENVALNEFELKQNYPNPFNPVTNIEFKLDKTARVTLEVFNSLGQKVATILNNELRNSGVNEVTFDASELPSGVYTYKLTVQGKSAAKKMVLMK